MSIIDFRLVPDFTPVPLIPKSDVLEYDMGAT
jgi:hypothetical protein